MTNIELRNAKRHLEAALLRAYQAEVTKFEKDTGLRVTAIEIGLRVTEDIDRPPETILSALKVRVEL